MLNLLKQFGSLGKAQGVPDLLDEDLVLVEQRVEPAKRAAQIIHKKLVGCLQGQQGLDVEKRMKKLPLMLLSVSMAESFRDFDGDSSIRKVLEMCCYIQNSLAKTQAGFEVQLEKEVMEPLNKLSEEDLPEILKNKKQFCKLTTDWLNARNRCQTSTGPQAKQDGLREELEEAWRKLQNTKDQYSADLYHFATKEDDYANYFICLLELQAGYHRMSLEVLERNILELKQTHKKADPQTSTCSGKVYGVALLSHLTTSGKVIATPIQECVHMLLQNGLQEEGLFRLAAAASVVKKLKCCLDHGTVNHSKFSADPHAVAGALKSYLRELPEPLMTFELYHEWLKASSVKEVSDRLDQMKVVLSKLPKENYNNLRYLVQFLACLSEHQAVNKMSPSNIAIVLGPNLLWPQSESNQDSLLDMASASSVQVVTVIEPLIQHAQILFPEDEDFEIPELPKCTNVNKDPAPSQSLTKSTSTPCVVFLPKRSSSVCLERTDPLVSNQASASNCKILWEKPVFGSSTQNQMKNPETSLHRSASEHRVSSANNCLASKAKQPIQQHQASPTPVKENQAHPCPTPHASAPSRSSVKRRPQNKKLFVGPPTFPPPRPPQ